MDDDKSIETAQLSEIVKATALPIPDEKKTELGKRLYTAHDFYRVAHSIETKPSSHDLIKTLDMISGRITRLLKALDYEAANPEKGKNEEIFFKHAYELEKLLSKSAESYASKNGPFDEVPKPMDQRIDGMVVPYFHGGIKVRQIVRNIELLLQLTKIAKSRIRAVKNIAPPKRAGNPLFIRALSEIFICIYSKPCTLYRDGPWLAFLRANLRALGERATNDRCRELWRKAKKFELPDLAAKV